MTLAIKRLALTLVLIGAVTTLFGCHTAHGFGQDVEKTGEKIQQKTE